MFHIESFSVACRWRGAPGKRRCKTEERRYSQSYSWISISKICEVSEWSELAGRAARLSYTQDSLFFSLYTFSTSRGNLYSRTATATWYNVLCIIHHASKFYTLGDLSVTCATGIRSTATIGGHSNILPIASYGMELCPFSDCDVSEWWGACALFTSNKIFGLHCLALEIYAA
jgi:hypothetical protein